MVCGDRCNFLCSSRALRTRLASDPLGGVSGLPSLLNLTLYTSLLEAACFTRNSKSLKAGRTRGQWRVTTKHPKDWSTLILQALESVETALISHKNGQQPVYIWFSGASYLGGNFYLRDDRIPRTVGAGRPLQLVQYLSTTDLVLNIEACRQLVEDPGRERSEDLFCVAVVWKTRISGQLVYRPAR